MDNLTNSPNSPQEAQANNSKTELPQRIEQITQTMLIALSEWQAGQPVDYHSAKTKGRQELLALIESATEQAYKNGWNDRESDLINGIDRVYGETNPLEQPSDTTEERLHTVCPYCLGVDGHLTNCPDWGFS